MSRGSVTTFDLYTRYTKNDLESFTVVTLRAYASAKSIIVKSTSNKSDIINSILTGTSQPSPRNHGSVTTFDVRRSYTVLELENFTLPTLKSYASELGIRFASSDKKADIINLILYPSTQKKPSPRVHGTVTTFDKNHRYSREELEELTTVTLRSLAAAKDIKILSTAKKMDIIEAILTGNVPGPLSPRASSTSVLNSSTTYSRTELSKFTIPELKAYASNRSIKIPSASRKAEIVELILEGKVYKPAQNIINLPSTPHFRG